MLYTSNQLFSLLLKLAQIITTAIDRYFLLIREKADSAKTGLMRLFLAIEDIRSIDLQDEKGLN